MKDHHTTKEQLLPLALHSSQYADLKMFPTLEKISRIQRSLVISLFVLMIHFPEYLNLFHLFFPLHYPYFFLLYAFIYFKLFVIIILHSKQCNGLSVCLPHR